MPRPHTDLMLAKSKRTPSDTIDIMDADGYHSTSTHIDVLNYKATDGIRTLLERGNTVTVRLTVIDPGE